jgi:ArsR family transcriptional regulator, arsenate/arsenite/antimonite-responsive transcriptional repressor
LPSCPHARSHRRELTNGPPVTFMNSANIERISKALANETRLLIFKTIIGNTEMSCGAIGDLRGVTPATVSHHLKILSDAGLIESRRHGQFIHNRVVAERIVDYARALLRLCRAT